MIDGLSMLLIELSPDDTHLQMRQADNQVHRALTSALQAINLQQGIRPRPSSGLSST